MFFVLVCFLFLTYDLLKKAANSTPLFKSEAEEDEAWEGIEDMDWKTEPLKTDLSVPLAFLSFYYCGILVGEIKQGELG